MFTVTIALRSAEAQATDCTECSSRAGEFDVVGRLAGNRSQRCLCKECCVAVIDVWRWQAKLLVNERDPGLAAPRFARAA